MSFATVNDTLDQVQDYKGKVFKGIVVDNNDPNDMHRIKCRVPNMYEPDQGDVPWIGPEKQSLFGIGPGFGMYGVPAIGATVTIVLQDGDPHFPMYRGSLMTSENKNAEYASPDVWGFVDPSGNRLKVDMKAKTWSFQTNTGYKLNIDGAGNLSVDVPGTSKLTSGGDVTVESGGNMLLKASGTATYQASAHQFKGPITGDSTLSTAGDITDLTGQGNSRTVGDMRRIYDDHDHQYWDDGTERTTDKPNQQI